MVECNNFYILVKNSLVSMDWVTVLFLVVIRNISNMRMVHTCGPGWLSRYSDSLRAGRSGVRIPVRGEIFHTRLDRPWGPPSLLYNEYRVFPGDKAAGAWILSPTPSSAKVKERVECNNFYILIQNSLVSMDWSTVLFLVVIRNISNMRMVHTCGPGWLSRYSDSLRAGRSGDRIPVEARFSAPA